MPTETADKAKKRTPSDLVAFEVPLAGEIREVSKLTGIPFATIRAQIAETGQAELARMFSGKVHAAVVQRQAQILQNAAKTSLDAGATQ